MRYKRVISFGDSFTWGTDLKDCTAQHPDGFSKLTWPALISNYLNLPYHCYAIGGASNQGILRRVLEYPLDKNDLVIVNWTWSDRYEFFNLAHNPVISQTGWATIRPTCTSSNSKLYYKHFHSELGDKFTTLQNMVTCLHYLQSIGCNFFMTSIDKNIIKRHMNSRLYTTRLLELVNNRLVWFNNEGFYQWAKDNDFPLSDTWHPLEEAHQAAFEYIRDNYDFTK